MTILPTDRDQTPVSSILCSTNSSRPTCFSVPEFLHTFDALIGQRRSEIDEYLSRHPKLASNIRSLQSISAAEISNDLPTPPPESPPLEKVGTTDHGVCVNGDANLKTNIEALSGRSEFRILRPRLSETPNQSVPRPVSHDGSRKSLRENRDVNAEVRLEETNRSHAQHSDDGLKRDYILAKAAADVVANELTAPDTMMELREVILQERNRISFNVEEPLSAFPKGKTESEEVAEQLECLRTHFEKLRQNEHIKTIADRYHSALIVQLYDHYNKPKRTMYSLDVIFTKILLKDWVRKNLKNTTERTRRKKMQTKWKAEVQKHRIWLDFNDEFGCGALSVG